MTKLHKSSFISPSSLALSPDVSSCFTNSLLFLSAGSHTAVSQADPCVLGRPGNSLISSQMRIKFIFKHLLKPIFFYNKL